MEKGGTDSTGATEPDVSDLLSVAQAIAILDGTPVTPRAVERPLHECMGLRLAQDVLADRDYPPFDKSQMDGYAVRCADVATVPATLKLVGEVPAGSDPKRPVGPGEAIAIMTGAPVPPGADGVVPVEDVQDPIRFDPAAPPTTIRVLKSANPHRYIARAGADVGAGTVVLRSGTKLEAAQLAVAATVGASMVKVFAAPRVGILATGDEIVPHDAESVARWQIRNSNNLMLQALLTRMGCRVIDLGHARDEPETLRKAIIKGIQLDALFITGGMSMGRYDYVPGLLKELGADLKITKLRIKPGKPFVFATLERKKAIGNPGGNAPMLGPADGAVYVFGLPGNPVSSFACTLRLASRLLAKLAGGPPADRYITATLAGTLPLNGPREFYQPVQLERSPAGVRVRVLPYKGSADLFTLAQADGLLVRPENEGPLTEGATVRVLEL